MHLRSQAEMARALGELKSAIEAFLPVVRGTPELQHAVQAYEACVKEAERLLASGFCQEDLASLADAVPQLFWLHKEWIPPLEQTPDGTWREPEWFKRAEPLHRRVLEAAYQLHVLGEY